MAPASPRELLPVDIMTSPEDPAETPDPSITSPDEDSPEPDCTDTFPLLPSTLLPEAKEAEPPVTASTPSAPLTVTLPSVPESETMAPLDVALLAEIESEIDPLDSLPDTPVAIEISPDDRFDAPDVIETSPLVSLLTTELIVMDPLLVAPLDPPSSRSDPPVS